MARRTERKLSFPQQLEVAEKLAQGVMAKVLAIDLGVSDATITKFKQKFPLLSWQPKEPQD